MLVAGLMPPLSAGAEPAAAPSDPVVCFVEVDFDDRETWASNASALDRSDLDVIQLLDPYEFHPFTRSGIARLLVDPAPQARDALSRELLAFVLNVRHRLASTRAYIELPDGTLVSIHDAVDTSLAAWAEGPDGQRHALTTALAALNESDRVRVSSAAGCIQVP